MFHNRSTGSLPSLVRLCCNFHSGGPGTTTKPSIKVPYKRKIELKVPKKKTWSKIAILQSLANSFIFDEASDYHLPLNNRDFYPSSKFKRFDIDIVVDQGKTTSNEVKIAYPNYYSVEWIDAPEGFKHRVYDPPPTVNGRHSDLVNQPSCENLKHLLHAKEPSLAQQMYMKLLEKSISIPQELVEKTFALVCFDLFKYQISSSTPLRTKSKLKEDYDQLIKMFERSKNLSPSLYCTMIRAMVKHHMMGSAVSLYDEMRKKGYVADLTTSNLLLGAAMRRGSVYVSDKFLYSILEDLKIRQIKPTIETFSGCMEFVAALKKSKVKVVLQEWSKYLREMEILGLDQNLVLFGCLLTTASSMFQNKELVNAILDITEQERFCITGHFNEYAAFHEAMRFAYLTADLELAKRIWGIAMSDHFRALHLFDAVNLDFYRWYFLTICNADTVESILDTCCKMMGTKIFLFGESRDALLLSAVQNKCPQLLPYIFSIIDMKPAKFPDVVMWLKTALHIVQYADAQTKQQLSNIVMIISDFMKKQSEEVNTDFLSDLCMLLAMCSSDNKREDIFAFLGDCKKMYPNVTLNQKALDKCYEAVGSNKHAVVKLRSFYPTR